MSNTGSRRTETYSELPKRLEACGIVGLADICVQAKQSNTVMGLALNRHGLPATNCIETGQFTASGSRISAPQATPH